MEGLGLHFCQWIIKCFFKYIINNEKLVYWLQNIILRTFSYDEQINEINQTINELVNKKQHGNKIDRRYEQIKDLKHMKNNIINRL